MHDVSAMAEAVFVAIEGYCERSVAPLRTQIADLQRQLEAQSAADHRFEQLEASLAMLEARPDMAEVRREVSAEVSRALGAVPGALDIEVAATPVITPLVAAEVARALAAMPQPKDGKDGAPGRDGADGAPGAPGERGLDGAPGRDGVDGRDGKDGAPGQDGPEGGPGLAGQRGLDGAPGRDGIDGRDGKDGESVNPADIAAIAEFAVRQAFDALPKPKDGLDGKDGADGANGKDGADGIGLAGAIIDRAGQLVITFTNGQTKDLGLVVGRDGVDGLNGDAGAPGRDGFSLEDFAAETKDGGRTLVLRFVKGVLEHTVELALDTMIYRGVFKDGEVYARGDTCTWAGSLWHCEAPTSEKPGEGSKSWVLAAKRGRDGKDGLSGPKGDPGQKGEPGRDGRTFS